MIKYYVHFDTEGVHYGNKKFRPVPPEHRRASRLWSPSVLLPVGEGKMDGVDEQASRGWTPRGPQQPEYLSIGASPIFDPETYQRQRETELYYMVHSTSSCRRSSLSSYHRTGLGGVHYWSTTIFLRCWQMCYRFTPVELFTIVLGKYSLSRYEPTRFPLGNRMVRYLTCQN